jgi:hypothetical protein
MSLEEFWAEIHDMGLTRITPTVFRTRDGDMVRVPDPLKQNGPQRAETIDKIRFIVLGIVPVRKREQVDE